MSRAKLFRRHVADSPIEHLVEVVKDYLHMPDPSVLYALFGAVAANMMEGVPVWLMLVGPSSSGGTEILNMLMSIPGMVEAGMIESSAAFMSGTPSKDKSKNATGGLLREVGVHGGIIMKDFTSVLSLHEKSMLDVLKVLREVYDGRAIRPVGSDGGQHLHWEGHAAFFAKCTNEIEFVKNVASALGERWVYFRLDETGSYEKSRVSLLNSTRPRWREDLRDLTTGFFMGQDLHFGDHAKRRELTSLERHRVTHIGQAAATARSDVKRELRTNEPLGVINLEGSSRIATALGQLLVGMDRIGVKRDIIWPLLRKIAFDSIPLLRCAVVKGSLDSKGVWLSELHLSTKAGKVVIRRAVEDLEALGVVEGIKIDGGLHVTVTPAYKQTLVEGGWEL